MLTPIARPRASSSAGTRVQRGVSLDHVVHSRPSSRQAAAKRADDTGDHSRGIAERIADRDDELADANVRADPSSMLGRGERWRLSAAPRPCADRRRSGRRRSPAPPPCARSPASHAARRAGGQNQPVRREQESGAARRARASCALRSPRPPRQPLRRPRKRHAGHPVRIFGRVAGSRCRSHRYRASRKLGAILPTSVTPPRLATTRSAAIIAGISTLRSAT